MMTIYKPTSSMRTNYRDGQSSKWNEMFNYSLRELELEHVLDLHFYFPFWISLFEEKQREREVNRAKSNKKKKTEYLKEVYIENT